LQFSKALIIFSVYIVLSMSKNRENHENIELLRVEPRSRMKYPKQLLSLKLRLNIFS